jgi:hypothetical protein
MALSGPHQKFLIIEQGAVPTVFNFALNGAIAWALFRSAEEVPLWGESSLGVDLLATAFLLPFLTCLIVSAIVARHVRDGKVPPLAREQLPHTRWFERSALARGLALGAAGVVFAALPLVWVLTIAQAQPLAVSEFVTFKAVWAALLALVVTPLIGWWALANASFAQRAAGERRPSDGSVRAS